LHRHLLSAIGVRGCCGAVAQARTKAPPGRFAWNFNLGSLPGGWKRALAGRILRRVDRFVVHASGEIVSYAKWLGVKENRFCFVPLQIGGIETPKPSPIPAPYIVSMGSANRDYKTLVEAISGTGIRTVIISKMDEINNLPERPELMKLANLTLDECHSILSGARLSVVPIANTETASGQVTFTTSMRMGIPTIANRSVGTVDYIRDGETGLLVPPGDVTALRRAIGSLWRNETLRDQIGSAGRDHAEDHFSDEAAGRYFAQILDEVFAKQEEV
jgi:glycosyltransferase involved in cell wall biosynthesis